MAQTKEAVQSGGQQAEMAPRRRGMSIEARLSRWLLRVLGSPPVEFELRWTAERVPARTDQPLWTVRIADRSTLLALLREPLVNFGDAFSDGRIEVAGDLTEFMEMVYRNLRSETDGGSALMRLAASLRRPATNTLAGSRNNIRRHYDLSNDFYALWLGETMAYTCAYYAHAHYTLEQAQTAKMDHVCRKLWLSSQDSVVEAGCGWGSLALHMARRYGSRVRAFNISREQLDWARFQARSSGLDSLVEFIDDDYRNISGKYDAFVSVGMLEHVGPANYRELGNVARRSLGPQGRGLIHSIGRNRPEPMHPWIEKRIFPGAYPPSLGEAMQIFEPTGLSILDVENLRLHYAHTVADWTKRYEASLDRIRALGFDEHFVRMWRLYLAGSEAAFLTGELQLFQILFATKENNQIPPTRDYMYPH